MCVCVCVCVSDNTIITQRVSYSLSNILTNKREITSDATGVMAPTTSGGFGQRNIPGIAADVRFLSVFNPHPSYRFILVIVHTEQVPITSGIKTLQSLLISLEILSFFSLLLLFEEGLSIFHLSQGCLSVLTSSIEFG